MTFWHIKLFVLVCKCHQWLTLQDRKKPGWFLVPMSCSRLSHKGYLNNMTSRETCQTLALGGISMEDKRWSNKALTSRRKKKNIENLFLAYYWAQEENGVIECQVPMRQRTNHYFHLECDWSSTRQIANNEVLACLFWRQIECVFFRKSKI